MNAAPTWHQLHGIRRRWQLRNKAAHIQGPDWMHTGRTLCGRKDPPVTIDPQHRNNPANKPCARCKAAADRLNLPTNPTP